MSCATCPVSRRRFLLASAGLLSPFRLAGSDGAARGPWDGPAVVRKVYLGGPRAGWPRPDVDLQQDVAGIEARLAKLERSYPGRIQFTGGELIRTDTELEAWLEHLDDADAVLAFNMITIIYPRLRRIVETGKPTLMFAVPYAGHDWTHAAAMAQKGMRIDLIASSDFGDLDPYVELFQTIHHLRHSKVLLMAPERARPKTEGYAQQFGTLFAFPSYLDLKAAYHAAPAGKAAQLAAQFLRAAEQVVEPKPEEIADSLRLHLAIQALLEQAKANAIAIDCLGGFGRGELPAYPCVSFSKLNDAGFYGVCECDLESTMTQLLVTPFSRMPGFVSDPVFDTSRNEVIHAHCVSATRLVGIDRAPSPYRVRSHLEDHKGVSMQVLAPAGGPVTVARFADPKKMMVSGGEAIGNADDERGCRTKIRTRVPDSAKLLANWAAALNTGPDMPGTRDLLHRVVFYGDHIRQIERLGRLLGFQVVHEA
jgi:hypothetical protein